MILPSKKLKMRCKLRMLTIIWERPQKRQRQFHKIIRRRRKIRVRARHKTKTKI